eukprot:jgi/Mesvir1/13462/Mv16521-RA.1
MVRPPWGVDGDSNADVPKRGQFTRSYPPIDNPPRRAEPEYRQEPADGYAVPEEARGFGAANDHKQQERERLRVERQAEYNKFLAEKEAAKRNRGGGGQADGPVTDTAAADGAQRQPLAPKVAGAGAYPGVGGGPDDKQRKKNQYAEELERQIAEREEKKRRDRAERLGIPSQPARDDARNAAPPPQEAAPGYADPRHAAASSPTAAPADALARAYGLGYSGGNGGAEFLPGGAGALASDGYMPVVNGMVQPIPLLIPPRAPAYMVPGMLGGPLSPGLAPAPALYRGAIGGWPMAPAYPHAAMLGPEAYMAGMGAGMGMGGMANYPPYGDAGLARGGGMMPGNLGYLPHGGYPPAQDPYRQQPPQQQLQEQQNGGRGGGPDGPPPAGVGGHAGPPAGRRAGLFGNEDGFDAERRAKKDSYAHALEEQIRLKKEQKAREKQMLADADRELERKNRDYNPWSVPAGGPNGRRGADAAPPPPPRPQEEPPRDYRPDPSNQGRYQDDGNDGPWGGGPGDGPPQGGGYGGGGNGPQGYGGGGPPMPAGPVPPVRHGRFTAGAENRGDMAAKQREQEEFQRALQAQVEEKKRQKEAERERQRAEEKAERDRLEREQERFRMQAEDERAKEANRRRQAEEEGQRAAAAYLQGKESAANERVAQRSRAAPSPVGGRAATPPSLEQRVSNSTRRVPSPAVGGVHAPPAPLRTSDLQGGPVEGDRGLTSSLGSPQVVAELDSIRSQMRQERDALRSVMRKQEEEMVALREKAASAEAVSSQASKELVQLREAVRARQAEAALALTPKQPPGPPSPWKDASRREGGDSLLLDEGHGLPRPSGGYGNALPPRAPSSLVLESPFQRPRGSYPPVPPTPPLPSSEQYLAAGAGLSFLNAPWGSGPSARPTSRAGGVGEEPMRPPTSSAAKQQYLAALGGSQLDLGRSLVGDSRLVFPGQPATLMGGAPDVAGAIREMASQGVNPQDSFDPVAIAAQRPLSTRPLTPSEQALRKAMGLAWNGPPPAAPRPPSSLGRPSSRSTAGAGASRPPGGMAGGHRFDFEEIKERSEHKLSLLDALEQKKQEQAEAESNARAHQRLLNNAAHVRALEAGVSSPLGASPDQIDQLLLQFANAGQPIGHSDVHKPPRSPQVIDLRCTSRKSSHGHEEVIKKLLHSEMMPFTLLWNANSRPTSLKLLSSVAAFTLKDPCGTCYNSDCAPASQVTQGYLYIYVIARMHVLTIRNPCAQVQLERDPKEEALERHETRGMAHPHSMSVHNARFFCSVLFDNHTISNPLCPMVSTPLRVRKPITARQTYGCFGKTPLHLASDEGMLDVVRYLIKSGADVNALDKGETTPLHLASENGHFGVVQELLKSGAAVNAKDQHGLTPLIAASGMGRLDVVQALIESGADLDAKGSHGTPLHRASCYGFLSVMQKLVDSGADLNAKDTRERRPGLLGHHIRCVSSRMGELTLISKVGIGPHAHQGQRLVAFDAFLEIDAYVQTKCLKTANRLSGHLLPNTVVHTRVPWCLRLYGYESQLLHAKLTGSAVMIGSVVTEDVKCFGVSMACSWQVARASSISNTGSSLGMACISIPVDVPAAAWPRQSGNTPLYYAWDNEVKYAIFMAKADMPKQHPAEPGTLLPIGMDFSLYGSGRLTFVHASAENSLKLLTPENQETQGLSLLCYYGSIAPGKLLRCACGMVVYCSKSYCYTPQAPQAMAIQPAGPSSSVSAGALTMRHMFLSHDWGKDKINHQRVVRISQALRERGFTTWLDSDLLIGGDIAQQVGDGIDSSMAVLTFITKCYMDKVNSTKNDYCRLEFHYAMAQKGSERIVPVVMEEELLDRRNWCDGTVKNFFGQQQHVSMVQETEFTSNMPELLDILAGMGVTPNPSQTMQAQAVQPAAPSERVNPGPAAKSPPSELFLSYDLAFDGEWQLIGQECLVRINQSLKELGFKTWFDEDQRFDCSLWAQLMASRIRNSQAVLVLVTQGYINKVNSPMENNSKMEFNCAVDYKTPKRMIPVVMDEKLIGSSSWPDGDVKRYLGQQLNVCMARESDIAANMPLLLRTLAAMGVTPNACIGKQASRCPFSPACQRAPCGCLSGCKYSELSGDRRTRARHMEMHRGCLRGDR